MRILEVEANRATKCRILLGESISRLKEYCGGRRTIIVADPMIVKLYGEKLKGFEIVETGMGEEEKTLETVEKLYSRFLELGLDRNSFVVGIGGGIACDIAGFAASTYLRGIGFGFAPTTLLAQVDASVGGKNGVNYRGYKNLIGTFNQPEFVLCDFELLKTLPPRQVSCGFAENIKCAAIANRELFEYLEGKGEELLKLERPVIEKAVYDSLAVKAGIVARDEREQGERRKLNFGHTLGHAYEKVLGIPHGEAISIGMVAAAKLSVRRGMLKQGEADRLENLLAAVGLPTSAEASKDALLDAMLKDKKREEAKINFVLLRGLGDAQVVEMGMEELEALLG
ncbi:3-dehydroquinate synthase [Candidatus Micrarchaeota archaeon]|nr:3-dehydroquinate synthase [Candidatus Micrarchaeota archaeon]